MRLGAVLFALALFGAGLWAQSPGQSPSPATPGQVPSTPAAGGNDNPFPGESSEVPVIPVSSGAADTGNEAGDTAHPQRMSEVDSGTGAAVDPDGDPVRSPDGMGFTASDAGFSSSRSGLEGGAAGPEVDTVPGRSTKAKTRDQVVKENVDVGGFYLDRKNLAAALLRFQSAYTLDSEIPEAVYGLAEAERHLEQWAKAREHYTLFLAYDPEGPKSKGARKALDQLDKEHPAGVSESSAKRP